MIVLQINADSVFAIKGKGDPQVSSNRYAVRASTIALEPMKAIAGKVHIVGSNGRIEAVENASDSGPRFGGYAPPVIAPKESL